MQTIMQSVTALRLIRSHIPSMLRACGATELEKLWRAGDTVAFSARIHGRLVAIVVTPGAAGAYDLKINTDRIPDISGVYRSAMLRRELKATLESEEYKNAQFEYKLNNYMGRK